MKRKILSILMALLMMFSFLPLSAFAVESCSSGAHNPEVIAGSTVCSVCEKELVAELTMGAQVTYLTQQDGYEGVIHALSDSEHDNITAKLLADLSGSLDEQLSYPVEISSPNLTLDLNGHVLDIINGYISMDSGYNYNDPAKLTVIDSTDTPAVPAKGELKAGASIEGSGSILEISSGSFTAQGKTGDVYIDGQMNVSGTAQVSCDFIYVLSVSTWGSAAALNISGGTLKSNHNIQVSTNPDFGENAVTNARMNISGGEVEIGDNEIIVSLGGELNVSGGKINGCISVEEHGKANVSGGFLDKIGGGETCGDICLSGGVFNMLPVINYLKDGYAYYDCTVNPTDNSVTKGDLITPKRFLAASTKILVAPHDCNLIFDETLDAYSCNCGRRSFLEPVAYLNEQGRKVYCTEYTLLSETFENSQSLISDSGWYYLDESITADSIYISRGCREINLILGDNAVLSLSDGLYTTYDTNLNIYAQSNGADKGKLIVDCTDGGENGGGITVYGNITVNGGELSIGNISGISEDYISLEGIHANNLTVNNGEISIKGVSGEADTMVSGINCVTFTVNGGSITIEDIKSSASQFNSHANAILCNKTILNGGTVTISDVGAQSSTESAYAIGIYGLEVTVNKGLLEISDISSNTKDSGVGQMACGIGIWMYGIDISRVVVGDGGKIAISGPINAEAKIGEVYSYGIYSGGISINAGGTVETVGGTATINTVVDDSELFSQSIGISVEDFDMDGGKVIAAADAATGLDDSTYSIGILVYDAFNVSGGTIVASCGTVNGETDLLACADIEVQREASITGGTIKSGREDDSVRFLVKSDDEENAKITVSGGNIKLCGDYFDNICVKNGVTLESLLADGYGYCVYDADTDDCEFITLNGETELSNVDIKANPNRVDTDSSGFFAFLRNILDWIVKIFNDFFALIRNFFAGILV